MNSFPPLNDNDGIVVLATKGQTIIDNFHYYEGLHYPLLNSTDGVSLERISFDRPTDDATNWHSASETAGFATPAYQNSQFMNYTNEKDNITILPEIFSPDNDGYNDVLNIIFSLTFQDTWLTSRFMIREVDWYAIWLKTNCWELPEAFPGMA